MIKEIAKKIVIFIMLSILMLGVFGLWGCTRKASDFSEEEHFKRVTERIEKKFMTDSTNFTKFEVYPLYNENDELEYFLVEFEPYGFVYVLVSDETPFYVSLFGGQRSMYKLSNTEGNSRWSRYTIDESNNQIWETDENGETIVYNKSPYSIANMQEGR